MRVRDLIHLLQTRAKPDDEINFTALLENKDGGVNQIFGDSYKLDFDSIWTDIIEGESMCNVIVPQNFIHNLLVSLGDLDLPKITNNVCDENGKNLKSCSNNP